SWLRPEASMLVAPRRRIEGGDPGLPLPWTTVAPATFPWIDVAAFTAGTGRFVDEIWSTVKGSRTFWVAPTTPVTMTSWSAIASGDMTMLTVVGWPAATVTCSRKVAWPRTWTVSVYRSEERRVGNASRTRRWREL